MSASIFKIRDLAQHVRIKPGTYPILTPGWTNTSLSYERDSTPRAVSFTCFEKHKFCLEFHAEFTQRSNEDFSMIKERMLTHIKHDLYGGVIEQLNLIAYKVEISSQREIIEELGKLVKDLQE